MSQGGTGVCVPGPPVSGALWLLSRRVHMHQLAALPVATRSYLGDFVARWRKLVVLRALGIGLAVFLAWTIIACGADRLLHLSSVVRLSLLLAGAGAALITIIRPLRT